VGRFDPVAADEELIVEPGPVERGLEGDRDRLVELGEDREERVGGETPVLAKNIAVRVENAQREIALVEVDAGEVHGSLRGLRVARQLPVLPETGRTRNQCALRPGGSTLS
jgi:hypothetical protein